MILLKRYKQLFHERNIKMTNPNAPQPLSGLSKQPSRTEQTEQVAKILTTNYVNMAPPPTDAMIARDPDLAKQAKYYSLVEWENRNK